MKQMQLTAREAAFVLDVSPDRVNRAFDKGTVFRRAPGKKGRTLDIGDLVLLRLEISHPDLSAQQRRVLARNVGHAEALETLGKELRRAALTEGRKRTTVSAKGTMRMLYPASEDGVVKVDLSPAVREVARGKRKLDELAASVDERDGDDPVLRGTAIPVHRVAALVSEHAGSKDLSEARKGFPSLSDRQIEMAFEYAKAYPKKGRPYPARSVKSLMDEIVFPALEDEDAC